jgi:16S rRNA (guanine527-N7)-methyltransferase
MIATEEEARSYVAEYADKVALDRLDRFAALLKEENTRQNLVAQASLAEIWRRHIADSAQLLAHVPRETIDTLAANGIWLDLGTGAGFPGLAIAILRPEWDLRLVESRRRRSAFLETIRMELGLQKCSIIGSRLEMVPDFTASVISARAFAPMPRLIDLSARFSTERTLWLLPKGRSAAQDLAQLPESTREMFHVEQSCTDPEAGIVIGRLQRKGGKQQVRRKA